MSFNTNTFKQSAQVGQLDLQTNPNPAIFTVRNNPGGTAGTDTILAGEGVRLFDLGGSDSVGSPIVAKRTANTQPIFGVRVFNTKSGETDVGEEMEVAADGAVIWMRAAGALTRAQEVSLVVATVGDVAPVSTNKRFGICLDKAADNELVRVKILANGL